MGLRCLIGHDFGELQTAQERRERGEEVVVTIREYRECSRCGETRVISENKEVRRVEPATDESEPATDPAASATMAAEDVDAEEDDGVILEEDPDADPDRERGEWPEDEPGEAETEGEPTPWPEVEGEDEGYAAEPGDGGPAEGVEFSGSLTPEAAGANDGRSTEPAEEDVVEASEGVDEGFSQATPGPSPTAQQRATGAETEFYCPECRFTTPTENSSLRPGDICPECRLGYLTERDR